MRRIAVITLVVLAVACAAPETQSTAPPPDPTTAAPAVSAPTAAGHHDKQHEEITKLEAGKTSTGAAESGASAGLMSLDPLVVLSTGVQRVEPKKVCMINERVFANDQIPIEVAGKTYYGCCEMCKTALAQDASKRAAIDPVSKREVDKASAVIGADRRGRVYYFENEANLRAFNPPA